MSDGVVAKRRGRPALDPKDKKRRNVTFRLRDSFREEIEQRAVRNGRSMSEEIETILERFVPLADIITKEFANDVRGLMNQYKIEVYNRKSIAEMARWNAVVFRKIARDIKDQSEAIQERANLYLSIDTMMINMNINQTDREAVIAALEKDLSRASELLDKTSRVPEMPDIDIKDFNELS